MAQRKIDYVRCRLRKKTGGPFLADGGREGEEERSRASYRPGNYELRNSLPIWTKLPYKRDTPSATGGKRKWGRTDLAKHGQGDGGCSKAKIRAISLGNERLRVRTSTPRPQQNEGPEKKEGGPSYTTGNPGKHRTTDRCESSEPANSRITGTLRTVPPFVRGLERQE